ncbi:hypothetical protein [Aquibacillus rhizosphaerae]|uniref:Flagellar hook-length control protein-like C-terminal domain-containing protein n=1 Tax=Aquibacillus rhizosphaerae TaxID=3051431 RepID=A0ABT7L2G0_9BACI|nr:hypothetical protein [Aquibacillus sp. LR5S19]MDL4840046.1 hypothetical protein [Aquibacillus sp. LR5S19]
MTGTNPFTSTILKTFHSQRVNNEQQLRPGNVLSGKVLEIYPNQRAMIQLGGKQLVAQLETSLNLHNSYWFQVKSVGDMLRLKVLVDKPLTNKNQAELLLKELGLTVSKEHLDFITTLIEKNIPFDKNSLSQALELSNNQQNREFSQKVLLEMMRRNLPITSSVLQALIMKDTSSIQEQLISLNSEISKQDNLSAVQRLLTERIMPFVNQSVNEPKTEIVKMILDGINRQDDKMFTLLKKSTLLTSPSSFNDWQRSWSNWQVETGIDYIQGNDKVDNRIKLPFDLDANHFLDALYKLRNNQLPISQSLINQFSQLVNKLDQNLESATIENQLRNFIKKNDLLYKINGLLTDSEKVIMNNWLENRLNNKSGELLPVLKDIAFKQLPVEMEKLMTDLISKLEPNQPQTNIGTKELFLTQLKQFLLFSGIDHESFIHRGKFDQLNIANEQSLKSLVLQALQEGNGSQMEKLEKLLHSLNGIQLTSVQQEGPMIQTSIHLPADKFGLKSDVQIDFESRKDETGKINPDFCQIIFYLDLNTIGETIINMSIQKRLVNVTVYNQHSQLEDMLSKYKTALKMGLNKIDYHLSTVQFKSSNVKQSVHSSDTNEVKSHRQGVDFRI